MQRRKEALANATLPKSHCMYSMHMQFMCIGMGGCQPNAVTVYAYMYISVSMNIVHTYTCTCILVYNYMYVHQP